MRLPLNRLLEAKVLNGPAPADFQRGAVPESLGQLRPHVSDTNDFSSMTPEQIERATDHGPTKKNETFVREVAAVINRLNLESGSNTPDYLLAEYLWDCLQAFNTAVYCRDKRHPVRRELEPLYEGPRDEFLDGGYRTT